MLTVFDCVCVCACMHVWLCVHAWVCVLKRGVGRWFLRAVAQCQNTADHLWLVGGQPQPQPAVQTSQLDANPQPLPQRCLRCSRTQRRARRLPPAVRKRRGMIKSQRQKRRGRRTLTKRTETCLLLLFFPPPPPPPHPIATFTATIVNKWTVCMLTGFHLLPHLTPSHSPTPLEFDSQCQFSKKKKIDCMDVDRFCLCPPFIPHLQFDSHLVKK